MDWKVGRLCVHAHILSAWLRLWHWPLHAIGFQGAGRQNPGSSHVRAPSRSPCVGRFNIKSFNYLQANEIPYFPPKSSYPYKGARRWMVRIMKLGQSAKRSSPVPGQGGKDIYSGWQTDICRVRPSRKSGLSARQGLWKIVGRSALHASSVCANS
jgi:hypothetical protein